MGKKDYDNDKFLDFLNEQLGVGELRYKNMVTALRSNGKSKAVEDFNSLEEYYTRFNESPSIIRSIHDEGDVFYYNKVKENIKKEFPSSKLLFSDSYYDLETDKYLHNKDVWYIDEGYILGIWISVASNVYVDPKLEARLKGDDEVIEQNILMVPSDNSSRSNKDLEKNLFKIFKSCRVKEYYQNSIGMVSVDSSGGLYVKEFTMDKKFDIDDLDLHYGENFKEFSEELFKKLKINNKGLVLLHGVSGSGKTFFVRYLLKRLSKTKKKILYFPPSMVELVTDPSFFNFITEWTKDNGKNSILLIEDAEPLLMSRESGRNMGITNLLNLTDGILNDILSIQIIATFNTNLSELDDALLRPERLIARKNFTKLTIENGKRLAIKLNIDPDLIKKEMTLAEIYSIKNYNEVLTHGVDKDKDRRPIGFKKN